MTIEEKRRELFESAAQRDWDKSCCDFERLADGYQNDYTDVAWWAFNAALDAVVITLPDEIRIDSTDTYDHGAEAGFVWGLNGCREAIESTGLGLKVLP